MDREEATLGASAEAGSGDAGSRVAARYTHHVWHTDFTFVPTWMGIWVPWAWFSLPQFWPFGWWVCAVVDQHSRAVLAMTHWKTLRRRSRRSRCSDAR